MKEMKLDELKNLLGKDGEKTDKFKEFVYSGDGEPLETGDPDSKEPQDGYTEPYEILEGDEPEIIEEITDEEKYGANCKLAVEFIDYIGQMAWSIAAKDKAVHKYAMTEKQKKNIVRAAIPVAAKYDIEEKMPVELVLIMAIGGAQFPNRMIYLDTVRKRKEAEEEKRAKAKKPSSNVADPEKRYETKGTTKCSYCGASGHNRATCPYAEIDKANGVTQKHRLNRVDKEMVANGLTPSQYEQKAYPKTSNENK